MIGLKNSLLILIILLLVGCTSTPNKLIDRPKLPSSFIELDEPSIITPLTSPSKVGAVRVIEHEGEKVVVLNSIEDLKLIMKAYEVADSNAQLVNKQSEVILLYSKQLNQMKSLIEFEEYRMKMLEYDNQLLEQKLEDQSFTNNIELISWKLVSIAILGLSL